MIQEEVQKYIEELQSDAKRSGYNINTDKEFLYDLAEGLLINKERYGYGSCPCRLSGGSIDKDMDLICPCDYRDKDLGEYGSCYCGLYISQEILEGTKQLNSIPDRRKTLKAESESIQIKKVSGFQSTYPIWRCKVCGYLCARTTPPEKCPICKAQKERFEELLL